MKRGELVVSKDVVADVLHVFERLFDARFPIERMERVDVFGGDDDASMAANNTSAFNHRTIAGTTRLSHHAKGIAIDINPWATVATLANAPCSTATCLVTIVSGSADAPCNRNSTASRAKPAVMRSGD